MTADVVELHPAQSGWSDKKHTAEFFDCSVSQVEKWMQKGMPHSIIAGRPKFKPAEECEPWLAGNGLIERRGAAA